MTTKKSGVNLHPKLPRTPGPRTRGRSNRAVGGRGVSPVTTGRYGRNSLSMQDAMNLAAEAATEADAKTNKPARSSKKAQHSRVVRSRGQINQLKAQRPRLTMRISGKRTRRTRAKARKVTAGMQPAKVAGIVLGSLFRLRELPLTSRRQRPGDARCKSGRKTLIRTNHRS